MSDVKPRCGGIGSPMNPYRETTLASMERLIEDLRPTFKAEHEQKAGYHFGYKFYSNDSVAARIRHAASEEQYLSNPQAWVLAGLEDAASADADLREKWA